jgi:hypothetical protein
MWYNIDFIKLSVLNLPSFMRKSILMAYAKVLCDPIADLHYQWKQKRLQDWYKIEHTGQVCRLRKALNDALDVSERRIYIDEGNSFPRKYIYTRAEKKPVFLGTAYIYQNVEYLHTGADFIVFVPKDLISARIYELTNIIEYYKLASKRYQIRPI